MPSVVSRKQRAWAGTNPYDVRRQQRKGFSKLFVPRYQVSIFAYDISCSLSQARISFADLSILFLDTHYRCNMSRNAAHAQTPSEKAVQYHGLAIRDESTYSRDTPRIIRTYDGESEVFALTLSLNLVEKIRRALCFGRWHRRLAIASEAAIDKLDSERVDRRALIESLKFHIGLKKRDIEHEGTHTAEQLEELEALTRRLHRNYADRKTVQKEVARFRGVVKTSLKDWKQSWLLVDKILDLVWMEAGLLVPYEEDADSVTSHNPNGTSPSETHGSHATSNAQ